MGFFMETDDSATHWQHPLPVHNVTPTGTSDDVTRRYVRHYGGVPLRFHGQAMAH